MSHVFYETFTRHAHGEGIKGHSTHYCPGCGHGLVHKFVSQAIAELGIQDETVAISPVGCSVFLYYYMDVGNQQAAHGRAPAVALGQKLARPDSIVISYQGDGDLASIGLAEIVSAAQLGVPITVIFINNTTYGMTGGQMAPTTLIGQVTATSPDGRTENMGQPMKVAEIIAGLDGPVYVERVALYDVAQRAKAKKAIKKAIQLQKDGVGFSFIEVLSECPVQLKMDPVKASQRVKDEMVPIYPLGVKKDTTAEANKFEINRPPYEVEPLLKEIGASSEAAPRFAKGFPAHLNPDDIAIKFAGSGGDGAQTAALLLTRAGLQEGFDSTHIPSYGPESRGGTSYADVRIAREEVLSPAAPTPDVFVAFNQPSLTKFASTIAPGGILLYDSTVIFDVPELPEGVKVYGVPFSEIAQNLGKRILKNVVCLGAFQAATKIFPEESFLEALRRGLKPKLHEINFKAFAEGAKAFREKYGDK